MPGRLVKVTDEGGRLSDRGEYQDESLGPCGPSRRRSPDEERPSHGSAVLVAETGQAPFRGESN